MSSICQDDNHPINATRRLLEQEGACSRLSIGESDDGLGTDAIRRLRQDHVDGASVAWIATDGYLGMPGPQFTDLLTETPQQAELARVAER